MDLRVLVELKGTTFGYSSELVYRNNVGFFVIKIMQSAFYSLFLAALLGVQIFSGAMIIAKLENQPEKLAKLSILTLALCCMLDFSSMINLFALMVSNPVSLI